jgi:hypothetical protein
VRQWAVRKMNLREHRRDSGTISEGNTTPGHTLRHSVAAVRSSNRRTASSGRTFDRQPWTP